MADELRIKVKIDPEIDDNAKKKFQTAINSTMNAYADKGIKIPVVLDVKDFQNQINAALSKGINSIRLQSSMESSSEKKRASVPAKKDTSYKENMTRFDMELAASERASKEFSSQLQEQMTIAAAVAAQKDAFYKKNMTAIDVEIKEQEHAGKRFTAQLKDQLVADEKFTAEQIKNAKQLEAEKKRISKAQQLNDTRLSGFEKFGYNNSTFFKSPSLAAEYENIKNQYKSISKSEDLDLFEKTNRSADTFKRKVTEAGMLGQSFTSKLRAQMEKLSVYFSAASLMAGAYKHIKNMINTVVQLDTVVTDLQIATGKTRAETKELLNTYTTMGQELGATTVDVAKSADTWLRQGYSVAQTSTLIKNSMMLSKLGQLESSDATTALTSAMKGYGITVEESSKIVDKFTAIDMKAAVSAGYIATAMAETATSARLAGVDINKLTGYIASVGEVTQDGAESVGNFLKTLFARMGNVKARHLVDPESAESLSDVESTLSGLGIKLRSSDGEFNNFGTTLDKVGANWSKYSSVQQRAIAVAFSGTRQQEKFLTLMENYGTATDYAAVATDSAGTAVSKYENAYLASAAAAQDRFTASFEALSTAIMDSDLISGLFNKGSGILGFFTDLISTIGAIPVVTGVAAGSLLTFSNKGFLKSSDYSKFGFTNIFSENKTIKNDLKAFAEMDALMAKGMSKGEALKTQWDNLSTGSQSLGREIESTNKSFVEGSKGLAGLTLGAKAATLATKVLGLAINTVFSIGIAWAIGALIKLANSQQASIENANKITTAWAEQNETLKNTGTTIAEISSDYATLARGVSANGKNISLSTEEYAKYNDITSKIADMFPTMVKGYTDEGDAIIKNHGNIGALTQAYKDLKQAKYDEMLIQSNDVFEGFSNEYQSGSFTKDYSKIDLMETGKRIESELSSLTDIPDPEKQLAAYLDLLVAWEKTPGVTRKVFDNIGVNSKSASFVLENLSSVLSKVSAQNRIMNSEFEISANKLRGIYDAFLNSDFNALKLTGDNKNSIKSFLDSLDIAFLADFNSADEMNAWISASFIEPLTNPNTRHKMQEALATLTNPDLSSLPAAEYKSVIENALQVFPEEVRKKILLNLDFEFLTDEQQTALAAFEKKTGIKDIAKTLSLDDIKIILNPSFQFSGNTIEDLLAKLNEVKEEAEDNPLDIVVDTKTTITNLKGLEEKFKSLRDALQEMSDTEGISPTTLDSLSADFGSLPEFEALVTTLSKVNPSLAEVKTSLESLAGAYLSTSEVATQLSEGQEGLVISGLKSIGVTNAEAIVAGILRQKNEELAASKMFAATPALLSMTEAEITAFAMEQGYSDATTLALKRMYIEKIAASSTNFLSMTGQEIDALKTMAETAGATTSALATLAKVKTLRAAQDSGTLTAEDYQQATKEIEALANEPITFKNSVEISTTPTFKAPTVKKQKDSKSTDKYKEAAEAEFKYAKYLLDKKEISEHEYYKRIESINNRYYKGKEKYLDDYRQREIEVLNGLEKLRSEHFTKYFELCGKLYETHQEEKKYINDLTWASKNLAKTDEERLKIAEALAKAHADMANNKIEDLEHRNFLLSQSNGGVGTENAQIANLRTAQTIAANEANRLRAAGYSEDSTQIQAQQKKWWDLENTIQDLLKKITDPLDAALEDALNREIDSANELLEITKKLIEQEAENQIEALENQKTQRKEIVDLQKESLRLTEDARKYDMDVKDKTDGLSKLQSQADALALDDSREAKIKREELLNQIAEKQKELNEFQHENSIKNQEAALDKEQENFEKTKDSEIKDIEDWLNDVSAMNAKASDRIKNSSEKLYGELIKWNKKYGTGVDNDITKMWNTATSALKGYSTVLDAIAEKQAALESITSKKENGNNAFADMSSSDLKIREEMIRNSQLWKTADAKTQKDLNDRNMELGGSIGATYNSAEGRWYRNGSPLYHTGGVVGGEPTVGQNELMLLAKKGELIFNEPQQNMLLSLVQKIKAQQMTPQYNNLTYNSVAAMGTKAPINITVNSPIAVTGGTTKEVDMLLNRQGRNIANLVCAEIK